MRKHFFYSFALVTITLVMMSCASSKNSSTLSKVVDISQYKYIVFGPNSNEGDADLADVMLMVQNELSKKLKVVSPDKALELLEAGEHVLSPRINVKSEKWEKGQAYITINFQDFKTRQGVAVLKSSGIGWPVSEERALNAIRKELNKVFK